MAGPLFKVSGVEYMLDVVIASLTVHSWRRSPAPHGARSAWHCTQEYRAQSGPEVLLCVESKAPTVM